MKKLVEMILENIKVSMTAAADRWKAVRNAAVVRTIPESFATSAAQGNPKAMDSVPT